MSLSNPIVQSALIGVVVGAGLYMAKPTFMFHSNGVLKDPRFSPITAGVVAGVAWAGYQVFVNGQTLSMPNLMGSREVESATSPVMSAQSNIGGMVQSVGRPGISVGDTFD